MILIIIDLQEIKRMPSLCLCVGSGGIYANLSSSQTIERSENKSEGGEILYWALVWQTPIIPALRRQVQDENMMRIPE